MTANPKEMDFARIPISKCKVKDWIPINGTHTEIDMELDKSNDAVFLNKTVMYNCSDQFYQPFNPPMQANTTCTEFEFDNT
jgi:hypothetical protein